MKASRAAASFAFSRQRGFSMQLPPSSRKHSTSGGPSSARTTSPMVIDWAGRASVKPPPTPRWVEMKPLSARSRTPLARWLGEMPNSAAISLVANERPGSPASRIRARKAKSVNDVRRMGALSNICLQIIYSRLNKHLKYLFKARRKGSRRNGSDRGRTGTAGAGGGRNPEPGREGRGGDRGGGGRRLRPRWRRRGGGGGLR